jgi:heterodisulfide reductase subunit B
MKYAFFLGCTIPARSRQYEISTRKVANAFDIDLVDIEDFSCCGFPVKAVNQDTAMLMAARNIVLAEEKGLDICAMCSACSSVLTETNHLLKTNREIRDKVNKGLKEVGVRPFDGTIEVRHFSRILFENVGLQKIEKKIQKKLQGLKLANHYGCHYLKPSEVFDEFDNPENPRSLNELIKITGAEVVDYSNNKLCCGGAVLAIDENASLSIANEKLHNIKEAQANAISLICPFCGVMYDDNQNTIAENYEESYDIPVLYYPQILGLALGMEPKELGFQFNKVKTKDLLQQLGF